ncbi:hypothetical protein H4219_005508 [Mycoemilia scoparia]|uniref:Uncharacterized protein n=1 Tax=Mycoemilia scoparia TaxID=417184 RepID=A0A9W8DPE1_9FUNG|nr:hypothetical protein H4219_005508 [Mycoemilia scoparia]
MAATNPADSWPTSTIIVPEGPNDDKSLVYTVTDTENQMIMIPHYTFSETLLGNVTYFYQTLAMISVILSFLLMVIVISMFFIRKEIAKRPSVRLSGWMGLTDFVLSFILFMRFNYDFMSSRNEASLKVLNWLMCAMPLTFVLLNSCIVFQLQLTVLMRKERLAQILSRGYEAFSFTFGLGLPLITFKVFPNIVWDGQQVFFLTIPNSGTHVRDFLVSDYLWEFIAMAYCVVVTVMLLFKLYPVWSRIRSNHNDLALPEGTSTDSGGTATHIGTTIEKKFGGGPYGNSSAALSNPGPYHGINDSVTHFTSVPNSAGTVGGFYSPLIKKPEISSNTNIGSGSVRGYHNQPPPTPGFGTGTGTGGGNTTNDSHLITYGSAKQRNQIRKTILRIMLYPIVLIVFRLPYDIFITAPLPYYFYHAIYVLCGIQGIFNFVVFLLNPGLDEFWALLRSKFSNRSF